MTQPKPRSPRPLTNTLIMMPMSGFIYHHHDHDHVVPPTRISMTLSRHFSLSFISSGRSSGLHPVSSHSCCMYVRAGCPAFARPYVGVHRSTSLMSLFLLLQQCPACLGRLPWIVFVMAGRWPLLCGVENRLITRNIFFMYITNVFFCPYYSETKNKEVKKRRQAYPFSSRMICSIVHEGKRK